MQLPLNFTDHDSLPKTFIWVYLDQKDSNTDNFSISIKQDLFIVPKTGKYNHHSWLQIFPESVTIC